MGPKSKPQIATEEILERDSIGSFEFNDRSRNSEPKSVDLNQSEGSMSFNQTSFERPDFDFASWLGLDKIDVVKETKFAFSAVTEVVKPLVVAEKVSKEKPEEKQKKIVEFQFKRQQASNLEAQVAQARQVREAQEEERAGTAGLGGEQLAKESGVQTNFRLIRNAATRSWVALKAKWKAQKDKQKQSAFQLAAGRGKMAVNLNAAAEGGTGGAKTNISSTGGGAG